MSESSQGSDEGIQAQRASVTARAAPRVGFPGSRACPAAPRERGAPAAHKVQEHGVTRHGEREPLWWHPSRKEKGFIC